MASARFGRRNTLMGMFTRLIFRKPFHVARAVISRQPSVYRCRLLSYISVDPGGLVRLSRSRGMPKSPRMGDFPGVCVRCDGDAQQVVTATLLILGAGFLVANARLVLRLLALPHAAADGAARVARPATALLRARARDGGRAGGRDLLQDHHLGAAGLRRDDDVRVLRLPDPAEPPDPARILRGRHLVGYRLHPLQRGRRAELARGRALGVAGS